MTDVLVIGSGWAGTYASLLLAQQGKKVFVLEARERLGGRMFTHSWTPESIASSDPEVRGARTAVAGKSGVRHTIDLGGAWAHGFHEGSPLLKLASKYSAPIEVAKPTATKIVGPKGALDDTLAARLQQNLGAAQAAAQAVAADTASGSPANLSLGSFILGDQSPLFEDLEGNEKELVADLARLMHVGLGIPLEQAALKWTGYEKNFAGTDGTPVGGFQVLHSKLVDEAKKLGVNFITGEEVVNIKLVQEGPANSLVQVLTRGGHTYDALSVLVTIPLAVLSVSPTLFEPKLPERRQQLIHQTKVGTLNKIFLNYDKVWWDHPEAGTFIVLPTAHGQFDQTSVESILSHATVLVLSQSAPSGLKDRTPSLFALVGAEHGAALEKFNIGEITEGAHSYFAKRLAPNGSPPKPIHSFRSAWTSHPFTRGATTTPIVLGNGSPLDFHELGRSLWGGALGFAGEHTDIDNHGSIAGALISGDREASRLGSFFEVRALHQKL